MGKQILTAAIGRNEAKTLVVLAPLHRTGYRFFFTLKVGSSVAFANARRHLDQPSPVTQLSKRRRP